MNEALCTVGLAVYLGISDPLDGSMAQVREWS